MKTERFGFKLTPGEKQGLLRLADAEGERVAVILRRLIREALFSRALERSGPRDDANPAPSSKKDRTN